MTFQRSPDSPDGTEIDGSPDLARIRSRILAINVGSSSLKFALFTAGNPTERLVSGRVEKIGLPDAAWTVADTESIIVSVRRTAPNGYSAARLRASSKLWSRRPSR